MRDRKLRKTVKNGLDNKYIIKGNKKLRYGYTTGSCAAAAAQAAARLLFSREAADMVRLTTPGGITLFLEPLDMNRTETSARCAIQKDAGDDPDVTDGLLIYASVRLCGREESLRQMEQFGWDTGCDPDLQLENDSVIEENQRIRKKESVPGLVQMGNDSLLEENRRIGKKESIPDPVQMEHDSVTEKNRRIGKKESAPDTARVKSDLDGCEESHKTDVENEVLRYGQSEREACECHVAVSIRGGEGVGTVTLPGLEQPVGAPAINKVPREMILREVSAVCAEYGYAGGLEVTVSAPGGRELAQKTFNPRLGIEGGISILGTSGIVEPMSEQALVATIELEMRQKSETQKYLLVTPGNYGADYLEDNFPFDSREAVKCSNYVGQTIDLAVNLGLSGLLFVAHIGKFVKVAGGIMNTHSREADARMEILAACALQAGVDADCARRILSAVTTDEGLRILREADHNIQSISLDTTDKVRRRFPEKDVWRETLDILIRKIDENLNRRAQGRMKIGAIVFSNVYGELGRTEYAAEILERLVKQSEEH